MSVQESLNTILEVSGRKPFSETELKTALPLLTHAVNEELAAKFETSEAALRTLRQASRAIECSECFHPLGRHTDKYGCEVDRGDRQMGEGEISVAIGPCACNGGEPEKEILAALAAEGGK